MERALDGIPMGPGMAPLAEAIDRFSERKQDGGSPEDLAGAILHWYEAGASDLDWVRLLEWEALSTTTGKLVGEDERRRYLDHAFARLRTAQRHGHVPAGLDVAQLHLSMIALTVFPLAFPQMTRLATGLDPTDPRFRRKRIQFLRWLGERLAVEPTKSAKGRPRSVAHDAADAARLNTDQV